MNLTWQSTLRKKINAYPTVCAVDGVIYAVAIPVSTGVLL